MVWGTFFHICLFERGGRSKAIWAMPIQNQHISKRGFPYLERKRCVGIVMLLLLSCVSYSTLIKEIVRRGCCCWRHFECYEEKIICFNFSARSVNSVWPLVEKQSALVWPLCFFSLGFWLLWSLWQKMVMQAIKMGKVRKAAFFRETLPYFF